MKGADICEEGV